MAETTKLMQDVALSKTPQQIADTASEWVSALAQFVSAMNRIRNFIAEPTKDMRGAEFVQRLVASSATTLETMSSREGETILSDLDSIVLTLDTRHPTYKRLDALRSELYRLISETKSVMAANVSAYE